MVFTEISIVKYIKTVNIILFWGCDLICLCHLELHCFVLALISYSQEALSLNDMSRDVLFKLMLLK
jgi:hypothetical protein